MSSFSLKIIAVISMIIDHIGFAFFPKIYLLRIIGRLAMPIFAFQIALGFEHTKNRDKYLLRILMFAIISQLPFSLLLSIATNEFKLNIGFTFLFGLLILYAIEEIKPILGKIICVVPTLIIACLLNYDYYLYGVALVIIFYYMRKQPIEIIPLYISATLLYAQITKRPLQYFSLIALIPLLLYNGKKGKDFRYFFYAFYPLHMLVIYIIFKLCL